jgi:hypothetical protein
MPMPPKLPALERPDTPATSEADRREAQNEMRRAQLRYRQRLWRLLRSYRITLVVLLLGTAALIGLAAWPDPICVVGGLDDGACLDLNSYWTMCCCSRRSCL